jgi:adenosylcobinamide-GDP ribazoletransferase
MTLRSLGESPEPISYRESDTSSCASFVASARFSAACLTAEGLELHLESSFVSRGSSSKEFRTSGRPTVHGNKVSALTALQFLTRLPLSRLPYDPDGLSHAVVWFPIVGLFIGLGAAGIHALVAKRLPPSLAVLATLIFLVMITGALHEDGLADTADGLGGGWTRERALEIMRDSRIGTYGAVALVLSLLGRFLLLSSLPGGSFARSLVAAHVLCRWSTLPLSYFLGPARGQESQSARVAQRTSRGSLITGSLIAALLTAIAIRGGWWVPAVAAVAVTAVSGAYFQHRLGGITGDCFGAANQLVEIAVYVCGVWRT